MVTSMSEHKRWLLINALNCYVEHAKNLADAMSEDEHTLANAWRGWENEARDLSVEIMEADAIQLDTKEGR